MFFQKLFGRIIQTIFRVSNGKWVILDLTGSKSSAQRQRHSAVQASADTRRLHFISEMRSMFSDVILATPSKWWWGGSGVVYQTFIEWVYQTIVVYQLYTRPLLGGLLLSYYLSPHTPPRLFKTTLYLFQIYGHVTQFLSC